MQEREHFCDDSHLPADEDLTHVEQFVAVLFSLEDRLTSAMDNALKQICAYWTILCLHRTKHIRVLPLSDGRGTGLIRK